MRSTSRSILTRTSALRRANWDLPRSASAGLRLRRRVGARERILLPRLLIAPLRRLAPHVQFTFGEKKSRIAPASGADPRSFEPVYAGFLCPGHGEGDRNVTLACESRRLRSKDFSV